MAHPNTPHPRQLVAETRSAEQWLLEGGAATPESSYPMGLAIVAGRYNLDLEQMDMLNDCVFHLDGIEGYAHQQRLERSLRAGTSTLGHP